MASPTEREQKYWHPKSVLPQNETGSFDTPTSQRLVFSSKTSPEIERDIAASHKRVDEFVSVRFSNNIKIGRSARLEPGSVKITKVVLRKETDKSYKQSAVPASYPDEPALPQAYDGSANPGWRRRPSVKQMVDIYQNQVSSQTLNEPPRASKAYSDTDTLYAESPQSAIGKRSTNVFGALPQKNIQNAVITASDILKKSVIVADPIIPESRLVTVEINHRDEINQFQSAILSKKNPKIFQQIKGLSFKFIDVNQDINRRINALLSAISQSKELFSNLTDLCIGNILQGVTFILPESFNNLVNLSLGNINYDATVTLPNSLANLTELSMGNIYGRLINGNIYCTPILLKSLNNLQSLTFGKIQDLDTKKFLQSFTKCINTNPKPQAQDSQNVQYKDIDLLLASSSPLKSDKETQEITAQEINTDFANAVPLIVAGACRIAAPIIANPFKPLNALEVIKDEVVSFVKGAIATDSQYTPKQRENIQSETNLVYIDINIADLLNPTSEFNTCGRMCYNLKINNISEVIQLQKLFESSLQILYFKIQALDLSKIAITSKTIASINLLFSSILKNLSCSLENLSIGFIGDIISSESGVKVVFTLPESLVNLKTLSIGALYSNATLNFPKALNSLESLSIGDLKDQHISIYFPKSVENLTNFSIGSIRANSIFQLPESFKNLTRISIGDLDSTTFKFPKLLTGLKNLKIGNIGYNVKLTIPDSVTNLSLGSIRSFATSWGPDLDTVFTLPDTLESLTTLSIDSILENSTLNFPKSLKNLTHLSINSLHPYATLKLSTSFDNLVNLSIGVIHKNASITLPVSFPKLTNFTVRTVHDEDTRKRLEDMQSALKVYIDVSVVDLMGSPSQFYDIPKEKLSLTLKINDVKEINQLQKLLKQPQQTEFLDKIQGLDLSKIGINQKTNDSFDLFFTTISQSPLASNLKSLSIGSIGISEYTVKNGEVKCTLPESLYNLKTLSIGDFYKKATLNFPESLNSLVRLSIGTLNDQHISINFPKSLKSLTDFAIGSMIDNIIFQIPESFSSLTKLKVGNLYENASFQISESLKGLEIVRIGDIHKNVTLNIPDSVESLSLGSIMEAREHLPIDTLAGKADVSMETSKTIAANVFVLPDTLNNLKTFSIDSILRGATLKFPKTLKNVKTLSVSSLYDNASLILPEAFDNLINLSIGSISKDATLTLPITFPRLTNFTVGPVRHEGIRERIESIQSTLKPIYRDISIADLELGLYAREEKKLNLTLKINDIHKIDQLRSLILEKSDTQLFDRIFSLDFGGIKINRKTNNVFNSFLNFLADNLHVLPSFQNLVIGNIKEGADLKLPESLKITGLSIGDIFTERFELPGSFSNLNRLHIGYIDNNTQIHMPYALALSDFSIKHMSNHSENRWPQSLALLKNFAVGYIYDSNVFNLLKSTIDYIETLSIKYVDNGCKIDLSKLPENLKDLTIENIDNGSSVKIGAIAKNLKNINIGCIDHNSSFNLVNSLPNLTDLSIEYIDNDSKIRLPKSLPNLQKLTIQNQLASTSDGSLNDDIYAEIRDWLESNELNREPV